MLETQLKKCLQRFRTDKPDKQLMDRFYGILIRFLGKSGFGVKAQLDEITLASTRSRRSAAAKARPVRFIAG